MLLRYQAQLGLEIERMSQNSPFSVDEYPMSMGSPFSIEEYCDRTPNTESPSPLALSHEFSIDEYDYNEDLTYEEKGIEATTSVGVAHTNVEDHNEPINVCVEQIPSASPTHFIRVPCRNSRDRFSLVTSKNQLRVDVGKHCCAHGCMNAIGKDKLWSLRRYYFSLTGDEQDTYLATKMQMVKAIWFDIKISFEYYLFDAQQCCRFTFKISLCVSNMRLHRVQ